MKKTFVAAIAALFLFASPANAEEDAFTNDVHMRAIGDIVTLPDGSVYRYYELDNQFVESAVIDDLPKVVGVHCGNDGCAVISATTNKVVVNAERTVALAAFIVIRVVKPHWLPDWMTGRSSGGGGSTSSSAATGGGGAGGHAGPPGGVI